MKKSQILITILLLGIMILQINSIIATNNEINLIKNNLEHPQNYKHNKICNLDGSECTELMTDKETKLFVQELRKKEEELINN